MNQLNPRGSLPQAKVDTKGIEKMAGVHEFTADQLEKLRLVHSNCKSSVLLKSFRELRTRVYDRANGSNFICLVCSVVAEGGGSFVAANLASSIVLDKTKTAILVDCNLYSKHANNLLPVPANLGLIDYLDDTNLAMEHIVYASGVPRLRVLPLGENVDGGAEKFSSDRMRQAFDELKGRYVDRYIVVDAPPLSDYEAEVRIISEICDMVILVVPEGKVTKEELEKALDSIDREKLVGLVYNRTERL